MSHVEEINDFQALDARRLVASLLVAQTPRPVFAHTLDWLCATVQQPSVQARMLIVHSGGRPIGLLPLCVRKESAAPGSPRVLRYAWDQLSGPLGPCASATLLAGLRHIEQTPADWDAICLPSAFAENHSRCATRSAMEQVGFVPECISGPARSTLELPETRAGLLDRQGQVWHRMQLRHQHRLRLSGTVGWSRVRDVDQDDLQAESFDQRLPAGSLLQTCHYAAVQSGTLDVCELTIDGQTAAWAYNYLADRQVFTMAWGVCPAMAHLPCSQVLLWHMLVDGIERGDRFYDLGSLGAEAEGWGIRPSTTEMFRHVRRPRRSAMAWLRRRRQPVVAASGRSRNRRFENFS